MHILATESIKAMDGFCAIPFHLWAYIDLWLPRLQLCSFIKSDREFFAKSQKSVFYVTHLEVLQQTKLCLPFSLRSPNLVSLTISDHVLQPTTKFGWLEQFQDLNLVQLTKFGYPSCQSFTFWKMLYQPLEAFPCSFFRTKACRCCRSSCFGTEVC
jgi:hypothetical protein